MGVGTWGVLYLSLCNLWLNPLTWNIQRIYLRKTCSPEATSVASRRWIKPQFLRLKPDLGLPPSMRLILHCILQYRWVNVMYSMLQRHKVGRELSFFSSRPNWDSPNPSPAFECAPHLWFWGEGHTGWRERGWESPNSDEGTYTVVLFKYICTLKSADFGELTLIYRPSPEILSSRGRENRAQASWSHGQNLSSIQSQVAFFAHLFFKFKGLV